MGVTIKISEIEDVVKRVTYYPHLEKGRGNIRICGCEGDDTCVYLSGCVIDLTGDVYLGKYVMIGRGAELLTHYHDLSGREPLLLKEERDKSSFIRVVDKVIGDDVWIYRSVIMAKCSRIAKGVVIGVNSVVTSDILEEYTIWAGSPARKIGNR